MARHTFVTELELTKRFGAVTDVEYYDDMVDIPSKSEIREIVKTAMSSELKEVAQSVEVATKTAKAAAMDASVAREEIARIVETARETFRKVIDELLVPHYRFFEQLLGIELPAQLTSVASTRETVPVALSSNGSASAKSKKKTTRRIIHAADEDRKDTPGHPKRKTTSAAKTSTASKKMATTKKSATRVAQSRRKGSRPCQK